MYRKKKGYELVEHIATNMEVNPGMLPTLKNENNF